MLISILTKNLECELFGGDADILRIEYDSRRVIPSDLFCCINGTFKDGHEYARAAVEHGAAALLVERKLEIDIPQIIVADSRKAMADLAIEFYGNPAKDMTVVGITGTNGKTTTTYMIKSIAEAAGKKVGLIGTIRNVIGDRIIPTERTTPESVDLQRILRAMRDEGVELVIMEVSSHALDQGRVRGIEYAVGGFTNLTQDHLDYHKSFNNYLCAKRKLFEHCAEAVLNCDDSNSQELIKGLNLPVTYYAIRSDKAYIRAVEIEICAKNIEFDLLYADSRRHLTISIPGLFNVYNALLASGVALRLGFTLNDICAGLSSIREVSGRMEALSTDGFDFTVILDFAHTPDGLKNLLSSVQEFAVGRVISVFGCGGDRDKLKRPIMGEIGGRYSDLCVVTSDNPRTEDPMSIISSVVEGVEKTGCEYTVIENRREAIRYALNIAHKDDIIVLAGKGHENYQEINGVKYPFDEKVVVAELLNEMK